MNLWGIIKGLLVHEESDLTKELSLEVDSAATTGTRTTLKSAQTANRTVSLPDATDTLMGKDTVDVMTNKSYDADGPGNVLTNIEDENIKVGAAIDAEKIADGSVTNVEFQHINSVTSNVQDQLDANAQAIADHIVDAVDAHDASAISNIPAGTIAATDVQAAIDELDGDVQQVQLNLDNHMNDAVDAHDASAISSIPSGNLSATDVQSALDELQSDVDTRALDTDLQNHINDVSDAHDASAISNVPSGSIAATDVQAAIDELDSDIQGHITDAVDAHDASAISNVPSGNLVATDVQSALDELQSDIDTRATTASNIGTGAGEVFKQKTGSTLELRTIKAGTNVTITNNTDDITIAASGGGSSGVFVVYANAISNINLATAPISIDGIVTPPNGSLILVTDQTTTSQNGVYVYNGFAAAMTRATGWTTAGDFTAGREVFVQNGSFRGGTVWILNSTITTLDTDPVTFTVSGLDPRSFPVLNIIPRIANGTVLGSNALPFDSLTVGGSSGLQVYNSSTDFLSLRRNVAAGSTFPYTGTQDTLLTAGARGLYITSINSVSTTTATLGVYSGHANSAGTHGSGAVELVTGNVPTSTGNSGNILLQTGTTAGGGTRGKIKHVDGSEGTAGHIWTSTDTVGSGAWVAPAAPLGTYSVRGANCFNNTGTPNSQFDMSADVITLKNSNNEIVVRYAPSTVTNDITVAGSTANGRDQAGAFSNSSWVHFYWIWNGTTLASLSSAVAPPTGPTLPSGYTHWAYAGAVRKNSGGNLELVHFKGSHAYYMSPTQVLAGGTATTETAVDVSAVVPPNALRFEIDTVWEITTNGSGNLQATIDFRLLSGSAYIQDIYILGDLTANAVQYPNGRKTYEFPNIGQNYYYLWSVTTGTAQALYNSVLGYTMPNGGE